MAVDVKVMTVSVEAWSDALWALEWRNNCYNWNTPTACSWWQAGTVVVSLVRCYVRQWRYCRTWLCLNCVLL